MSSTSRTQKREDSNSNSNQKRLKVNQSLVVVKKHPRTFLKIPIFIVDYHNDVLQFIYRCLASRHLPIENNLIIHFDSHPDMVISREIHPSTVYNKDKLLTDVSIENWLMPTCYAGHFSKVIWVKNNWCHQMPIGDYNFWIGDRFHEIQVTVPLIYFLSEGNYCADQDLLQNKREMSLKVMNLEKEHVNVIDGHQPYILDIDLDFFSTSNPFLEIYGKANCYQTLCKIFHFEINEEDYNQTCITRRKQLDILKDVFEHLQVSRNLNNYNVASIESFGYEKIQKLIENMHEHYEDHEIDWLLVFNSGCTSDNGGLPHHISSDSQIENYMKNFENFLSALCKPPIAVTIARSAEDDYCPKSQVDDIQKNVLSVLYKVFGDSIHKEPINWFEEENLDWDVMKL